MSLKQECIDIINLITEPLKKNDYDNYNLEVDSIRDICELTGEDVTYSDCYDCEHYNDCTYKKYVKVDVSFCDYGDFEKNYVFSKKPTVSKGICFIRNRKQLMAEMSSLKKELEQYKDWYADFGEIYSDFMEYAKEFAEELKQNYWFFGLVSTDILPIVFHTDFAKDSEGKTDYTTGGNFCFRGKQSVINTYYCMDDIDKTKQNIRHELLHYFLYMSDMKHKDDNAIFHYLCSLYDAYAYKKMDEDEQKAYDRLVCAIDKLENMRTKLNLSQETFNANCAAMMWAIGKNEDNLLSEELYNNGIELLNLFGDLQKEDLNN